MTCCASRRGEYTCREAAAECGQRLARDGAHIIDIGGQSTRPGSTPLTAAEEMARIVPAVRHVLALTSAHAVPFRTEPLSM